MKKTLISISIMLAAVFSAAAEGGTDFSGTVETKWAATAPWTDSDSAGHFLIGDTSFTGTLDAYYGNSSAFAEGSIFYDATRTQEGLDAMSFSLSELWLDYTDSFWGIRIGRQKAAWGKADGIDITNILCPKDMSSFSAMVSDNSKLAVDAVRLSFNGSSFTADAYWIPFFTPAALPTKITSLETPEITIWNGEYGLKLSGYFSVLDFSLYGFYGWDDSPFLDYSITSSGITVSGKYDRLAMVGADTAIPLGETVIRLETAFFPQRYFQKSAESILTSKTEAMLRGNENDYTTTEQHNQISALAGIDWMPNGWTFTAQYFCDYIFGETENLSRTDSYKHGATVSISKQLLSETLEIAVSGIINFNAFDSFISPSVKYSLSDQINLNCGAYIIIPGPDKDGEYGVYKDYSSFYAGAKISF